MDNAMRKFLFCFGLFALVAGMSFSTFGIEVPLKYDKASTLMGGYAYGFGNGLFSSVKPAGKWALPRFNTGKPLYSVLPLGDKSLLLVLDTKKAGEKTYSLLWVDYDGNGELQDEKPVDLDGQKNKGFLSIFANRRPNSGYTSLDLKITVDGVQIPYCIQLYLGNRMKSKYSQGNSFFYQVACFYTGAFTFGGKRYAITLCDRNGNGRFDDPAIVPEKVSGAGLSPLHPKGDVIYLSRGKEMNPSDGMVLGDLLLVNDTLFILKVDTANGKLILEAVKGGLSPLKLPVRPERLSLIAEKENHCLMVYQPEGEVIHIPAGKYRLLTYQLLRKDIQGDLWRLQASGTGESPTIEVAKGAGAVPALGEPFTTGIEVQTRAYTPLGSNYLSFIVRGRGGEIMTGLSRIEGTATRIPLSGSVKQYPREPLYTIVKPDGQIVAKGSFEYG